MPRPSGWLLFAALAAACGSEPDVEVVGAWALPDQSVCDVFCADGERYQWLGRCDAALRWTCWTYEVDGNLLYLDGEAVTEVSRVDDQLTMFGNHYVLADEDPAICSQRCDAP